MQYRDLTIQSLGREQLVIACDTSASIGHKVNDTLEVDPKLTSAMCESTTSGIIIDWGGAFCHC